MSHELRKGRQLAEEVQELAPLWGAPSVGYGAVRVHAHEPTFNRDGVNQHDPMVDHEPSQLSSGGREAGRLDFDQLIVADDVHDIAVDALLDTISRTRVEDLQCGVQRTFAVGGESGRHGCGRLAALLDQGPAGCLPGGHAAVQIPYVRVSEGDERL